MSKTDWADEIAAKIAPDDAPGQFSSAPGRSRMVERSQIAAALRKERESTVERCAVAVESAKVESFVATGDVWRGVRMARTEIATAIRDLNIPKGAE